MNFHLTSANKYFNKYNVVTECQFLVYCHSCYFAYQVSLDNNLNLHQAAFTNDVGSAAFALRNGQPHNSVFKGTLPIHAASLNGSKDVLKMLIDVGADINAPRLVDLVLSS